MLVAHQIGVGVAALAASSMLTLPGIATAARTEPAGTGARAASRPASRPCGFVPGGKPTPRSMFRPHAAGCGLAPRGRGAWRTVTDVEVVGLELRARRTLVHLVLLDKDRRRVLPIGRWVSFDMQFRRRHRGRRRLTAKNHRDGVFTLVLPPNRRAKPCSSHLFVRYDRGGRRKVECWIDDWLFSC